MLCRKGWQAVVVSAVVAGLSFRAEGALSSDFPTELPANSALALTLNVPDFALINHHSTPNYLGSNSLPDLLPIILPQDLFSHRFADGDDALPSPDVNEPAWDMLWHDAARISIIAVPEPSSFALFAIATLLLGARNLRQRK